MAKTYQWYYDGVSKGTSKTQTVGAGETDPNLWECRVDVTYGSDAIAALARHVAASGEITVVGMQGYQMPVTGITLTYPTGTQEGDYIFLVSGGDNGSPTPTGVTYTEYGNPGTYCRLTGWFVGASESSVTMSSTGSFACAMLVLRGVSDPALVGTAATDSAALAVNGVLPARTPTAAGQFYVAAAGCDDRDRALNFTTNIPAGLTGLAVASSDGATTGHATVAIYYKEVTDTSEVAPGQYTTVDNEPGASVGLIAGVA